MARSERLLAGLLSSPLLCNRAQRLTGARLVYTKVHAYVQFLVANHLTLWEGRVLVERARVHGEEEGERCIT